MDAFGPLVECDWLATHLHNADVKVLDATWYLPSEQRDGFDDYLHGHIPGAVYFDIDAVADQTSRLPHMLPSAEVFGAAAGTMGLSNEDRIVVYDAVGAFSAPRVWWMFRAFGHDRVAVLNGGLKAWQAQGRLVEAGDRQPHPARFGAAKRDYLVRSLAEMKANLKAAEAQVVDARSPGRFAGTEPELRPGVRPGHIPGALNVHYATLIDGQSGKFGSEDDIQAAFTEAGVDLDQPIVTSCGSGVTAGILALGLALLKRKDAAVYDGSWTEWGGREETPVETGDGTG